VRRGEEAHLHPAPPYRDYMVWLSRQSSERAELFWRQRLAGFAAPTPLRGDRDPDGVSTEAEGHGEQEVRLPVADSDALRALARRHRLTLATLVQGAWALLLGHDSDERDVVFGATVAGRPAALPGVESMVGLFINTLPVRAAIDPERPLLDWLRALQEWQVALREFESTPLSLVQRWSDVRRDHGLFRSILVFENYPVDNSLANGDDGLRIGEVDFFDRNNYPLSLGVVPGRELALRIKHDAHRFSDATISRLLCRLASLLLAFEGRPDADLGALLATLDELDRRQFADRGERLRGDLRRLKESKRRAAVLNV
jgi:non-ribosomal peptide synthetase component F